MFSLLLLHLKSPDTHIQRSTCERVRDGEGLKHLNCRAELSRCGQLDCGAHCLWDTAKSRYREKTCTAEDFKAMSNFLSRL